MPSSGDSKPRHSGRAGPATSGGRATVGGLLLTGGASRRMGWDKALTRIDGEVLAVRLGRALAAVAGPAYEVGPGHSGLAVVAESTAGAGPLAALADGVAALSDGVAALSDGVAAPTATPASRSKSALPWPVIVLACDLPRLDEAALRRLADWPGAHSVVPRWRERPQPLCARWSAADLAQARAMVAAGERSLRGLLARPGVELTTALGDAVADADSPAELDALGVPWRAPS